MAAGEPADHLVAAAILRARRFLEIGQAAEADHCVDRERIGGAERRALRAAAAAPASQSARWPPALWPMATRRREIEMVARRHGRAARRRRRRRPGRCRDSRRPAGRRRDSRCSRPRCRAGVRSSAIQFMIVRSAMSVCQQPPWTMSTVGCGPGARRAARGRRPGAGRRHKRSVAVGLRPRPLEQIRPGHQAVGAACRREAGRLAHRAGG